MYVWQCVCVCGGVGCAWVCVHMCVDVFVCVFVCVCVQVRHTWSIQSTVMAAFSKAPVQTHLMCSISSAAPGHRPPASRWLLGDASTTPGLLSDNRGAKDASTEQIDL